MRSVLFGNNEICYSLERKKVKNINLRIKQSGEVYVSAPRFVCTERIDSFVLQNAPKILAAKKRFEAANAAICERRQRFRARQRICALRLRGQCVFFLLLPRRIAYDG